MIKEALPYKVLIVDDHVMARQIVMNVMQELNVHQVEMAATGKEAREAIYAAYDKGRPFDLVFLDWNIPDIAGIDILKHFRAHPEFVNTAFIMLTAEAEPALVLEAAKSGTTAYIVKPAAKEVIAKKFLETLEWIKKHRGQPKLKK